MVLLQQDPGHPVLLSIASFMGQVLESSCGLLPLSDAYFSYHSIYLSKVCFLTGFIFKIFNFLFLAGLSFRGCVWAFSSCGERGLLFVAVHGLLIAVASLVAEHGL